MGNVIRQAFKKSGLSILALSKRSGVPYAAVHGLVNGNSDARLTTASKVCAVLGLELRPKRKGER